MTNLPKGEPNTKRARPTTMESAWHSCEDRKRPTSENQLLRASIFRGDCCGTGLHLPGLESRFDSRQARSWFVFDIFNDVES